jgi:ABC-2 type transport system ATP-binding protein
VGGGYSARLTGVRVTSGTAVELESVSKCWGERRVLDSISLRIERGTVAWLGGENGSGKSTLLRIAAGLLEADRGSAKIRGRPTESSDARALLGFLGAGDRGTYARLSVRHNLEFAAGSALIPRLRRPAAVAAALKRFGLEQLQGSRADRLSSGEGQRLRLAAALIHEPAVALLDEPQVSLDAEGLELLAGELTRMTRRGGAAVWCSPAREPGVLSADVDYRLIAGRLERL